MSSVVVITPLVVASWPVISAAVTAAIGSMGFSMVANGGRAVKEVEEKITNRAEIEVQESEILAEAGPVNGELVVVREGVRAVFTRDERGALKLCVEGEGHSKAKLREIGEELIGRVTQQYVYHRVVTELQERHMTIVDEEVSADRTVKIRVRNL